MLRRTITFGIVTLGITRLLGCGGEMDEVPTIGGRPNVLLISIDTLRPDHLACYGYARPTSPSIDRLAAEGAFFENAISSTSWTLPAHAALLTGLADRVHGCYDTNRGLDDSRTTLAERLKDEGYTTVGFFTGPYLHPVFGLSQGFDTYVDCTSYADLSERLLTETGTVGSPRIENASHRDVTSDRLYDAVSSWLKAYRGEQPFFLFTHFWDVHFDYIPPPPYDTLFDPDYGGSVTAEDFFFNEQINPRMLQRDLDHVIALYDGEIAWTDSHVGKILGDLDDLGLSDATIVVLVSDHGTEFFEHGGKIHRRTLYDEVIRIPMIFRYPGRIASGRRLDTQVRIIDVVPTVLDLLDMPRGDHVMGQSLLRLLEGSKLAEDNLAVSELLTLGFDLQSFRRADRKMITDASGRTLMFDLGEDGGEQSPVSDLEPGLPWVKALLDDREQGQAWLEGSGGKFPVVASAPELPAHVSGQLRSLGYIGGESEERNSRIASTPDPFDVRMSMASSLIDVGRSTEALGLLAQIVTAHPDSARTHLALADALAEAGRLSEAAGHYEEALRLDGSVFAAHYSFAHLLMRTEHPERAMTHFRRATEIDSRSAPAYDWLGRVLVRLERIDEAIDAFRQVVRIDPENAGAQCNVGILLSRQGRLDEAVVALERALEIDPGHSRARAELAEAQVRLRSGGGE